MLEVKIVLYLPLPAGYLINRLVFGIIHDLD